MLSIGRRLRWSAFFLGSLGCQSDSTMERALIRRDSAGIVIVENPGHLANAASSWVVDSVPDLNIGGAEDDEHLQLFRVTGAAQLSDGRIVVVNAGTQEIRFFDRGGAFIASVGRGGDGPEEYQFPILVPASRYDTLWIFDRGRRLSVLDDQGRLLQSIGPRSRLSQPVGIWVGKLVTGQGSARAGPDTPEGMIPNDIAYEKVDLVTEAHDTIAEFAGFALYVWNVGGTFGFTHVPFDVAPSAAVARDRLFITGGEQAEVQAFDTLGKLREIFRTGQPSQPLSQAAFDRAVDDEVGTAGDPSVATELRRRFVNMQRPEVMPLFQNLQVDTEGYIWLEVFRSDNAQDPEWVVIDPSGRVMGRVSTPRGLTVMQIGRTFVLGLRRDQNDIEHVVRYRLARR
jgi:hypothetical protein